MSDADPALLALAERAGVAPRWRDAFGKDHDVSPDTLRAVLAAIDLPADSDAAIADSMASLVALETGAEMPPLVTARVGEPVTLPCPPAAFALTLEDGGRMDGTAQAGPNGHALLPPIAQPGYHRLAIGDAEVTLAVSPGRCFWPEGLTRAWGLAVQLYALRRAGDAGVGDFAALATFARAAGARGADAVAISPVHAQFSADPNRFSPYAPSSRIMLNVLHVDCPEPIADAARLESLDLVDWPESARVKLRALRAAFARAPRDDRFAAFKAEQGDVLRKHAIFEALHAARFGADPGQWNWRAWPEALRDPASAAVRDFANAHADDVDFHAWLQWRADEGLRTAQAAARAAGMRIGLISDLAVGTDGGGSHSWSRQQEMLIGMTVGAPPDLLSPHGQDWGLVAFSPNGLRRHGYAAFLEMLRAALRHAGGVRIDHVMGLARLWVLPEGASPSEGAYLALPRTDLLRLVALESQRHAAIVLGEDLGTLPEGFQDALTESAINGLRVLWFERDREERFTPPARWTRGAVAMTSTHDLPTVAGWWRGDDLDLRAGLGHMRDEAAERAGRARDRDALWDAFTQSGAAHGPRPAEWDAHPAVDAAIAHVGSAACELVLLPMEDALAQTTQPNLPGTLDEHPNWRRRMPLPAEQVLDRPDVAARIERLAQARLGQPPAMNGPEPE